MKERKIPDEYIKKMERQISLQRIAIIQVLKDYDISHIDFIGVLIEFVTDLCNKFEVDELDELIGSNVKNEDITYVIAAIKYRAKELMNEEE